MLRWQWRGQLLNLPLLELAEAADALADDLLEHYRLLRPHPIESRVASLAATVLWLKKCRESVQAQYGADALEHLFEATELLLDAMWVHASNLAGQQTQQEEVNEETRVLH